MVMVRLALLFGALYWGAEAYHSWTGGSNEAGFNAMIMLMILADWFFAARRKRKAS